MAARRHGHGQGSIVMSDDAHDGGVPVPNRIHTLSESRSGLAPADLDPVRRCHLPRVGATTRKPGETRDCRHGIRSAVRPARPAHRVRQLLALLHDAGHTDFRDARRPMGFTQRQAGGKFTPDEVDAFIEQLEAAAHTESPPATRTRTPRPTAASAHCGRCRPSCSPLSCSVGAGSSPSTEHRSQTLRRRAVR